MEMVLSFSPVPEDSQGSGQLIWAINTPAFYKSLRDYGTLMGEIRYGQRGTMGTMERR
jgi:hypothetical protein